MMELGISDSHDASVALIEDGKVLAAVSEERFTRKKRQQGFPFRALGYIKGFIPEGTVDKVCVAGKYGRSIFRFLNRSYSASDPQKNIFSFGSKAAYWQENLIASVPILRDIESKMGLWAIKSNLKRTEIKYGSIELADHHHAHIASALRGPDSKNYVAVSLDAYGDGNSGLIMKVRAKRPLYTKKISYKDSLALFYGYISAYLGFTEGEEGKVMALAAYGEGGTLLEIFKGMFSVDKTGLISSRRYKAGSFLNTLNAYKKEDVAFALQKTVEDVTVDFIKTHLNENEKCDLFLAGGLFANIRINQMLNESGLFDRVFVFPNMGDGGTAFAPTGKTKPHRLKDVYLGPEYTDKYISDTLGASDLAYTEEDNIEEKIAELLASGKTIARFSGRMEYGPRALGNRSILYRTDDITVNKWLNESLGRAEFMPFAPVTLYEYREKCYMNINGSERAAKFMTMSFNCTDWMKEKSSGVVHVDGTARPQILRKEDNPGYYNILKRYHDITGIPSLINTSFNMHNEPIVCSPEDAINTFKKSGLEYLAIDRFLAKGY
ncbi:carbamoyltransferase C-terminal domain-containing protein [Candidatus Omnitrophota bacterium]